MTLTPTQKKKVRAAITNFCTLYDKDTGERTTVVAAADLDGYSASWSRARDLIAFDNNYVLATVKPDGSDLVELPDDPAISREWSR